LGQYTFDCTIIGYCNIPVYTQCQIDIELDKFRDFCRVYIDDIVIASKTLEEYEKYLYTVLSKFVALNLAINPAKTFVRYPSTILLG
jgi:hypothetical protein